ncbi:MAG: methylenetetrahydrofolate reductase, partial [Pseudomonadota bacterium]
MMTTQQDTITHIQTFLKDATIEVTPTSATKIEDFRAHLDEGTIVYVTFLPGSDWHDTLECVKRLKTQNMRPVPHISARSTLSKTVLDESLARYRDEGCDQLLLIAGALEKPLGPFKDTIDILDTGLIQSYGYQKIGVAGHPEGSPDMSKQAICEALMAKNAFARETNLDLHIVTQFCFEFDPLIKWQKELAEWGNQLPIHI